MFAAKLTQKWLGSDKVWVLLFKKKSEQQYFVKFVNEDVAGQAVYFDRSTTCEPMSMRDARKFIGNDEPIWEHDGWSNGYGCVPFVAYEDIITYMGGAMPIHKYCHRRWNGVNHYDVYEETTEYRKVG